MNKTYRVAEVALRVTDMDRARAFYEGTMGLAFHKVEQGVVFLELSPLDTPLGQAGHPQLLALFGRTSDIDPARSTLDHLALEIPAEEFEAERAAYAAKGMVIHERVWPDSLPWRGRSFFFRDPDGNVIELIAALDPD